MSIRIEMLRNFVTVARVGELSKAAHLLSRTPSAVSMSLKQLQLEIPSPLFETEKKTKLSRIGKAVLEEAEKAVNNFDQSLLAIKQHIKSENGFIRIATVPSFATFILPPALRIFYSKMSGVRVDIRDMDSSSIVTELLENRIDIGVASVGVSRYGISSEILWEDPFEVFYAEGHPLSDRISVTLDDLNEYIFISNSLCKTINNPVVQSLTDRSLLAVHNTSSLLAMVREGIGITILPRTVINQSVGGVSHRPILELNASRRLDILTSAEKTLTRASIDLISALRIAASALRESFQDNSA